MVHPSIAYPAGLDLPLEASVQAGQNWPDIQCHNMQHGMRLALCLPCCLGHIHSMCFQFSCWFCYLTASWWTLLCAVVGSQICVFVWGWVSGGWG